MKLNTFVFATVGEWAVAGGVVILDYQLHIIEKPE